MRMVGHRWERDHAYRGYRCVPLSLGQVESHQWCVGCNCLIGDIELYDRRIPMDNELTLYLCLEIMAKQRGYVPVEAGSLEEFKLQRPKIRTGVT